MVPTPSVSPRNRENPRETDSRLEDSRILQAWVMNPQSTCDLVCSVGVYRGALDLLEVCSENGVSFNWDLVVPVCPRIFDEQRTGRHD